MTGASGPTRRFVALHRVSTLAQGECGGHTNTYDNGDDPSHDAYGHVHGALAATLRNQDDPPWRARIFDVRDAGCLREVPLQQLWRTSGRHSRGGCWAVDVAGHLSLQRAALLGEAGAGCAPAPGQALQGAPGGKARARRPRRNVPGEPLAVADDAHLPELGVAGALDEAVLVAAEEASWARSHMPAAASVALLWEGDGGWPRIRARQLEPA
eukprot:CAMPEP_0197888530 /NCGR_PEP_ID=MMETSP1439-20131203/22035_1 /TAXON_ID=66791 /ORGANISM="Gonyaulax spinifera, Strain CCMP409" /LENGTH=211 /DNA_ID=CAMNT_0043508445 /DNA_START=300 /DNA_END=932 /DNA_ORIENTATION=+